MYDGGLCAGLTAATDPGLEVQRMIHHGLTPAEALEAATRTAAEALGLDEHVGTVTEGKLADLTIIDGDPLAGPHLLSDPARIWLVLQLGAPVAGQLLANPGPHGPVPVAGPAGRTQAS